MKCFTNLTTTKAAVAPIPVRSLAEKPPRRLARITWKCPLQVASASIFLFLRRAWG
jgi:hypothetical protein